MIKDKNIMKNFVSEEKNGQIQIYSKENKYCQLPFNKAEIDFRDSKMYEKFIKNIESMVRRSKLYKSYIRYLKEDLKLVKCSVFGNIEQESKDSKITIEMHHGPIFTLYDYVEIILRKNLMEKNLRGINTFDISAEILHIHRLNLVQIVMLSESVHKAISNGKSTDVFLSLDQSFGNLYEFINKYNKYFSYNHTNKLKRYFHEYNERIGKPDDVFVKQLTKYNILKEDDTKLVS